MQTIKRNTCQGISISLIITTHSPFYDHWILYLLPKIKCYIGQISWLYKPWALSCPANVPKDLHSLCKKSLIHLFEFHLRLQPMLVPRLPSGIWIWQKVVKVTKYNHKSYFRPFPTVNKNPKFHMVLTTSTFDCLIVDTTRRISSHSIIVMYKYNSCT